MNDLSWLLYWAEVAPSLANNVADLCTIGLVVCLFLTLAFFIAHSEDCDPWLIRKLSFGPRLIPVFVVILILSSLAPSKETFYMIALSEGGEEVLKTPELSKIKKIVNNWLDDQITPEKGEEE